MEPDPARTLAVGTWLYDGSVRCEILLQAESFWPALEDPEDNPEATDRDEPCVSVWYGNPAGDHAFSAGGGYYHDIEEAKAAVEATVTGPVEWTAGQGILT